MYWDWIFFRVRLGLPSVIRFVTQNQPGIIQVTQKWSSLQLAVYMANPRRKKRSPMHRKHLRVLKNTPTGMAFDKKHVGKLWCLSFHALIASVDDFTHLSRDFFIFLVKPTKAQHKSLTKGRVSSPPYAKTLYKPIGQVSNHWTSPKITSYRSGFLKFWRWSSSSEQKPHFRIRIRHLIPQRCQWVPSEIWPPLMIPSPWA